MRRLARAKTPKAATITRSSVLWRLAIMAEAAAAASLYREPSCLRDVGAFHKLFKAPILDTPTIPDEKRCALRVNLIQEELNELQEAINQKDIVEIADALADIQYVLAGAVHEFGMGAKFADLFEEVQRSNMSKACSSLDEAEATVAHYLAKEQPARIEEVDGKWLVYRIADSKVLKSVNYSPASLQPILEANDKENGGGTAAGPGN